MAKSTDGDKPNFQVPNLERALQILEFLVGREEEISQREIALTMGYPVNSVMRILNALEYYGYIDRNKQNKKYTLSHKFSTMALSSAHQKNLMESSLDVMRELRDEIGETVVVSIVDGYEGLVLEQVQGTHPFRFVCDPGTRQNIHCSASCKSILAFTPQKERDQVIKAISFDKFTETTITSAQEFKQELKQVKQDGFAFDRAEALEGVYCAAAPVLGRAGRAIAAITVTGPSTRMTLEALPSIAARIKEKADLISQRMGYSG